MLQTIATLSDTATISSVIDPTNDSEHLQLVMFKPEKAVIPIDYDEAVLLVRSDPAWCIDLWS